MKKRRRIARKTCAHCSSEFTPDHRVASRQRYCTKAECRRASQRASHARWLNRPENRSYHRGAEQVDRVRLWRQENPSYRALQRRQQKLRRTLRRLLSPQLAGALISCGLQDLNDRQLALVLGLARLLFRVGLQEEMAAALRRAMFDGYALMRATPT